MINIRIAHKNKKYRFDCGCVIAADDVIYTGNRRGPVYKKMCCPIHGVSTSIETFVYQCPDCESEFESKANTVLRCPECAYKRKRALQKRAETYRAVKDRIPLEPMRKPDCQHYLTYCLPREANNEEWSCRFCKKYKPAETDVLAHITASDPMRAAYSWPAVW